MNTSQELPHELTKLQVGNKQLEFWTERAEVLEQKVWSETDIRSSRNGYGQVASVHSSNRTRREMWVRLNDGRERTLHLPDNTAFSARAGQCLSMVCVKSTALDHKHFYYVAIYNHATGQWVALEERWMLRRLSGLDDGFAQALARLFVLATLGLGLIPLELYTRSLTKKYLLPIQQRVSSIVSRCAQQRQQAHT